MSRLPKSWTFAGTSRAGVPSPGSGVVPITVTEGSPKTSAGLCPKAAPAANVHASAHRAALRRAKSADRDAPGQLAHRDVRDLGVGLGIDDRDGVRAPAGDVELAPVGRDRHVPGALADRDLGDDRVGRSVDDLHRALAAGSDIDALAVRAHDDAVRAAA